MQPTHRTAERIVGRRQGETCCLPTPDIDARVARLTAHYASLGLVGTGAGRMGAAERVARPAACLPGRKACRRCGVPRPLADFSPRQGVADGRGSYCRGCMAEAVAESEVRSGKRRTARGEGRIGRPRKVVAPAVPAAA